MVEAYKLPSDKMTRYSVYNQAMRAMDAFLCQVLFAEDSQDNPLTGVDPAPTDSLLVMSSMLFITDDRGDEVMALPSVQRSGVDA